MPFPERNQFRIKDLAQRWGMSEDDVREEIRTGHFKKLIVSSYGEMGTCASNYYINESTKPGSREHAARCVPSRPKQQHYNIHSIEDFPWPGDESTLYIPRAEIETYEKQHKIRPAIKSSKQNATEIAPQIGSDATSDHSGQAWIQTAKKIAIDIAKKSKNKNQEQIADKVHQAMVERHNSGDSSVTGRGGRVPPAATIKRRALKGIRCTGEDKKPDKPPSWR